MISDKSKHYVLKTSLVLLYAIAIFFGGSAWLLFREREVTHLVVMAVAFLGQAAIIHWYLLKMKKRGGG